MKRAVIAVAFCLMSFSSLQAVTITVFAKGKVLSMANPEKRVKSASPDIETKKLGDPRCVSTGDQILSLDSGCVLDTDRTYSTSTTPQCSASFGQGGPGYGIVVSSCSTHGGSGSHSMNNGTLTSSLEVCRKENSTQRGWYRARHELYMKCPTLEDWSQNYQFTTTLGPLGWVYVATLSPPPPANVGNLTFNISVESPYIAQTGLFAGNPNTSGDKGLDLLDQSGQQ